MERWEPGVLACSASAEAHGNWTLTDGAVERTFQSLKLWLSWAGWLVSLISAEASDSEFEASQVHIVRPCL